MRIALLALLGALSVGSTAQAQAQARDRSVFQPKFLDGRLYGCEVVFDNYVQDTAYLQGARVHVAGSWAFNSWPDKGFWGMLKVGVTPMQGVQNDTIAPADAYIIVDYASNKADQKFGFDSDTPGYKLFGFDASGETTMQALAAPISGQFMVAYTLGTARMPTTFSVILPDDDAASYSECMSALLNEDSAQ